MSYSAPPARSALYRQYSSPTSENLPPRTIARVARELRNLHKNPPEGVRLVVDDDNNNSSSNGGTSSGTTAASASSSRMNQNLEQVVCEMQGPTCTPYEGRFFCLKLTFSQEFPAAPPRGFFLTKIYHPNVDPQTGAICVNTLKKDWTAETTLSHVLAVIRCLLIVPFPESSLNDEAGKLFMESYEEYAKRARLMAQVHGREAPTHKTQQEDEEEEPLSDVKNNNNNQTSEDPTLIRKQPLSPTSCGGVASSSSSANPLRNSDNNKKVTKGAKMSKKKSLKRL